MPFEQFDIDLTLKPIKPKITLHKPDLNRTQIANITDLYDISYSEKMSNVDELTFTIPMDVERKHNLVKNKNIEKIKNRYLLKLTIGNKSKWFQIRKPKSQMSIDDENKAFEAFSLEIELSDKLLRGYEVTSKNCTQVLADVLNQDTIWNIDYVDASFDIMYRSFDISSKSVLDFILTDLQETFGAIAIFNTENRTISMYNPDNLGVNRGLKFSYNSYLESMGLEYDDDEHCTRVIVTGKDGISIQDQTPTGGNFLQDFSAYIYPFTIDESGNIIKHSYYLSDELCLSLLNYSSLLDDNNGIFKDFFSQKDILRIQLTNKQNELFDLNTQLTIILDNIDIAQAQNNIYDNSKTYFTGEYIIYNNIAYECIQESIGNLPTNITYWENLISKRDNKQIEVDTKQSEIDDIDLQITNINNDISNLQEELSLPNNFTEQQIIELNPFIIQKEINNDYISESSELLKWAEKEFEKIKTPPIKIDLNIINFLECIECQRDWDKLNLFDIVTVSVERFGINVQAKITEINRDFESGDIDIVISSINEIQSDKDKFIKSLNKSINTSTVVDTSKYKWNNIGNVQNDVNSILNQKWESSLREIVSGVEDSVEVNRRGITSFNPSQNNKALRITHGIIGVTTDNFNTLGVAIDGSGVYAERLIGQIIAGENLTITTGNGDFLVNQDGVKIRGTSLTIEGGLPSSELQDTFFKTDEDYTNGVKIDTQDGLTVTRSDNKVRSIFNATEGIKIQNKTDIGTDWTSALDVFYVDTSGGLNVKGNIDCTSLKIDGNNVLSADGKITTAHIENLEVGSNVTLGSNAVIQWDNLSTETQINLKGEKGDKGDPGQDGQDGLPGSYYAPSWIKSTYIDFTSVSSPSIYANNATIYGTLKGGILEGTQIKQVNGSILLADLYKDNYGGKLVINDNYGNAVVVLGCESGFDDNRKGTITINDGGSSDYYQRIEMGISKSHGAGIINLRGTNGLARVSIYGESNLGTDGLIALFNSDQSEKVRIRGSGVSFFNGGNVAIGRTTAYHALDVSGDIRNSGNIWCDGGYIGSTNYIAIANSYYRLVLQSDGNLVIYRLSDSKAIWSAQSGVIN